jgi:predicted phage tail protein
MCEKGKLARGDNKQWHVITDRIPALNSSYCVSELEEGHEYLFRLSALNEKGYSEPITLDKSVKPRKKVQPPHAPAGPLKVVSGVEDDQSLTISWSPAPEDSNASPLATYVIEIRDATKGTWRQVASVSSATSSYKITDLTENSEYFIRVRAHNEDNLTSQALELDHAVLVKSPFSAPSHPRDFKLVAAGRDKVTVEFKAAESDGGMDIRSYVIEKRDANRVTWIKAAKVKPKHDEMDPHSATYTCEVDELLAGGSYYFRVVAENAKGRSESVELEHVVKLERAAEKPSKPFDLNVLALKRPNSLLLDWKAPLYDGNDKIKQYIVEQWSSDGRDWKLVGTCDNAETSYTANNLREGSSYKFRVRAKNAMGEGEHSLETIEIKIQQDVTHPSAPQGPLKYTISDDQTVIHLEWRKPESTGGARIKRYIVEKKIVGTSESSNVWFKVGFTGPAELAYKIVDYFVEESSTFSYRIIAENEEGYKSTPLELTRPICIEKRQEKPEVPSYLRVREKTSTAVTLIWKTFSAHAYQQADRFLIEQRDKNTLEWTRVGLSKTEAYTVDSLDSKLSYWFRVIAVNDAGQSEPAELAEPVSMDITSDLPSMPIAISVDNVTQSSVALTWISPKNSGAKPIIGYKIYQLASINQHWQEIGVVTRQKKLNFIATGLDYHYDYRFKICAYSELGSGKFNETEKIHLKKPIGMHFFFFVFFFLLDNL